jgi:hypothetical protein
MIIDNMPHVSHVTLSLRKPTDKDIHYVYHRITDIGDDNPESVK